MWVKVARLMARVIVMRARHFFDARIAMPVRIKIAGRVARVVVVRTGDFFDALVAMAMRVEIARHMRGATLQPPDWNSPRP